MNSIKKYFNTKLPILVEKSYNVLLEFNMILLIIMKSKIIRTGINL